MKDGIDQGRELRHFRKIQALHSDFFPADKNGSETPVFTGFTRDLEPDKVTFVRQVLQKIEPDKKSTPLSRSGIRQTLQNYHV
jgi:hypothetical protein